MTFGGRGSESDPHMFLYRTIVSRVMPTGHEVRRAWIRGFTTGVAVCGLAVYAKRKLANRRASWMIKDEGTVIPIE